MRRIHVGLSAAALAAVTVQLGCSQVPPLTGNAADRTEVQTAGLFKYTDNVVPLGTMGNPVPGLTTAQRDRYQDGKRVFEKSFDFEPGEVANGRSCADCHGVGGSGGPSFTAFASQSAMSGSARIASM